MNVPLENQSPVAIESVAVPEIAARPRRRVFVGLLAVLLGLVTAALLVLGFIFVQGGWYAPLELTYPAGAAAPAPGSKEEKLAKKIAAFSPRGFYLVVDTYGNRLRVFKNGELLREAVCSTGSGTVLKDPRTGKVWVFDTPLGEHEVQRKVKNPIWVKPDWAFIEEGYQPPPSGSQERYDDFSLGDYGLYLGDGYIIHGTVFQTLLGRRVTHGCIRLGDADLEYVYKTVPLGSRVYIF
ncbi:MAG TPA: L,D-transpeptidase [Thermoanaerobaculia bacterium]|nr:L,D-transpeptidase [Thermoanaerobaculia bacterium]